MIEVEFTKQEEIPEPVRGVATQRDGKWILKLETGAAVGLVPVDDLAQARAKLEAFRTNNVALMRELGADTIDAAIKRAQAVKDLDPEEFRSLKEAKAKDGQKVSEKDRALDELKKQVGELATSLQQAREKELKVARLVAEKTVETALRDAAAKAQVKPEAIEDFVSRGQRIFRLDDTGALVAEKAGVRQISTKTGQPLVPEEWAATLLQDAPHLFQPSAGGGAAGGRPAGGVSGMRVVDAGARLTAQDVKDIAEGRAMRSDAA